MLRLEQSGKAWLGRQNDDVEEDAIDSTSKGLGSHLPSCASHLNVLFWKIEVELM